MTGLSLQGEFEAHAEFRREKAAEYPDDQRTRDAASIFDRLAATAKAVPPEVIAAYEKLFEDLPDAEAWNEALREVGFHRDYATAEEFVRAFIASRTTSNSPLDF